METTRIMRFLFLLLVCWSFTAAAQDTLDVTQGVSHPLVFSNRYWLAYRPMNYGDTLFNRKDSTLFSGTVHYYTYEPQHPAFQQEKMVYTFADGVVTCFESRYYGLSVDSSYWCYQWNRLRDHFYETVYYDSPGVVGSRRTALRTKGKTLELFYSGTDTLPSSMLVNGKQEGRALTVFNDSLSWEFYYEDDLLTGIQNTDILFTNPEMQLLSKREFLDQLAGREYSWYYFELNSTDQQFLPGIHFLFFTRSRKTGLEMDAVTKQAVIAQLLLELVRKGVRAAVK